VSHPLNEHRDHKVQKSRVSHIAKGYASGGSVHSDEAEDKAMIKRMVKSKALKADGGAVKARSDKPPRKRAEGGRAPDGESETSGKFDSDSVRMKQRMMRARGGRTKHKGSKTVVNVIAGGHPAGPMPGPMAPPMAPRPMMPPPPPMAGPPGMPPGMPPPGMPPRQAGGRAYAKGGAVKSGPAWEEGRKNGTQVQHTDGKMDGKDIGRKRVITYKTGGAVESPKGVDPATKLPGGSGGGEARLWKEHRAERKYARPK
jgi:hypothetical protein